MSIVKCSFVKPKFMTNTNPESTPLIMIVEDDRSMRMLLNMAMEASAYRVIEVNDCEQCLAEYYDHQPDLILLDAIMPGMDGFTCCQKIRSLPAGGHVPILMITTLDDTESIQQAFIAGATGYVTKPVHWATLSEKVYRSLNK